jgi:glycosylphosphatidylinositol transamidase (GPIT) subunit GPI8
MVVGYSIHYSTMADIVRPRLVSLLILLLAISDQVHASNSWAVIASSSRFWLNYRHTANALGVYNSIKRYDDALNNCISLNSKIYRDLIKTLAFPS